MFEKNLFQVEKMLKVQKVTELRAFTVPLMESLSITCVRVHSLETQY
jgi:hypothetical protein